MRFVDTNIFLRFLVNDEPDQADACEALFRKAIEGEESLFTSEMVIAYGFWSRIIISKNQLFRQVWRKFSTRIICIAQIGKSSSTRSQFMLKKILITSTPTMLFFLKYTRCVKSILTISISTGLIGSNE